MKPEKYDFYHTASRIIFFGGLFLFLFLFIKKISAVLTPFILAFIFAYMFAPLVFKMQYKLKMNRNLSAGMIVISIEIILILILVIGLPLIYNQIISLIQILPSIIKLLELKILPLMPKMVNQIYLDGSSTMDIEKAINSYLELDFKNIFSKAYQSGVMVIGLFSAFFLTPILMFYFLKDWGKISKTAINLVPVRFKHDFKMITREIRLKVSAYFVGEFYAIILLALLYGIGLSFTGLKFGFFLGVLTGFLSIIPYVGFGICFISAILIAFATKMTLLSIIGVIVVFSIVQAIESNYIVPKLVGSKVGLHPVWVIFGLLAGGSLLGFIGLVLAIPITAIASVLVRYYVKKYKKSEYYEY